MGRKLKTIRRFAFALEILIAYVLQGTVGLIPAVNGNKPSLLICAALTIALFENELCAMIFGFVCGALTDAGSGGIGFYTVLLGAVCFFVAYLCENVFVTNIFNVMLSFSVIIFILFSLDFALSELLINRIAHAAAYYTGHTLIRFLYTMLFVAPFYYLNGLIRRRS